jgi:hypothetical protein
MPETLNLQQPFKGMEWVWTLETALLACTSISIACPDLGMHGEVGLGAESKLRKGAEPTVLNHDYFPK